MASHTKLPAADHREAVRLSWNSLHVPLGTMLIGTLLLTCVASATSMMWAYGPGTPIP